MEILSHKHHLDKSVQVHNEVLKNIKVKEEKLAPKPTESMVMEGESKVQEKLGDSPRPRSCDSETGNRRSYMFIITLTTRSLAFCISIGQLDPSHTKARLGVSRFRRLYVLMIMII
ncbi:hypothetical protein RIR_jg35679.t1 [Rhizophagus irregularis DAOM 181602=DAOM 197198]|nr:hypothetical protein RIR_jg35679.t1 [Rhizophagus irregularis DAOM 181602=DAOM 197198]